MSAVTERSGPIGVSLPIQEHLRAGDYVDLAVLAEREGMDTAFVGEIAGLEAFTALGMLAARTESIRLATGVVSIYTRSVALTAMGFASAASLAPGRIVAGLGTGSHVVVDQWHGGRLTKARQRMIEFVTILRRALRGERINHSGEAFSVRDYQLQIPPPNPDIPVLLGSFNQGMLRLAGEIADGVILAFCPVDELPDRIDHIHQGAVATGRDPDCLQIAAYVNAYAGSEPDAAMERFRRLVLQYAVQPTHRAGFVSSIPQLDRATELWNAGERRAALRLVPDDAVLRLCPIGSATDVLTRLEAVRSAGVTLPVLFPQSLQPGDADSPAGTISAVAAAARAAVVSQ